MYTVLPQSQVFVKRKLFPWKSGVCEISYGHMVRASRREPLRQIRCVWVAFVDVVLRDSEKVAGRDTDRTRGNAQARIGKTGAIKACFSCESAKVLDRLVGPLPEHEQRRSPT